MPKRTAGDAGADNYLINYGKGILSVTPSGSSRIKVWASSSSSVEVRIYSEVAQKSMVTLYTSAGTPVHAIQKNLEPGTNSVTIPTGNIAREVYIVNVYGGTFK